MGKQEQAALRECVGECALAAIAMLTAISKQQNTPDALLRGLREVQAEIDGMFDALNTLNDEYPYAPSDREVGELEARSLSARRL